MTTGPLTIGLPEGGFTTGPTSLTINPGGTVNVAHDIDLDTNSTLKLQGGTLSAAEIGLNGLQFNGQFQWTAGTLHVGVFRKSLTNQGGTLAPGHSAGRTTIDGNYTQQAAGTMEIEIGGTTADTQYDVVGHLRLCHSRRSVAVVVDQRIYSYCSCKRSPYSISSGITGAFSNVANGQRIGVCRWQWFVRRQLRLPADAFDPTQVTLSGFQVGCAAWRLQPQRYRGCRRLHGVARHARPNRRRSRRRRQRTTMIDAGDYNCLEISLRSHAGSGSGCQCKRRRARASNNCARDDCRRAAVRPPSRSQQEYFLS